MIIAYIPNQNIFHFPVIITYEHMTFKYLLIFCYDDIIFIIINIE